MASLVWAVGVGRSARGDGDFRSLGQGISGSLNSGGEAGSDDGVTHFELLTVEKSDEARTNYRKAGVKNDCLELDSKEWTTEVNVVVLRLAKAAERKQARSHLGGSRVLVW